MKIGKTIGALAALVTIIVGGIAIYRTLNPPPDGDGGTPPPSFLERIAGTYTLSSWTPANRPIDLGFKVPEGSLEIGGDGTVDWSVLLVQTHTANPGRVRMTARGAVQLADRRVVGVQGGEFNNTSHLDARWGQVSSDVGLAVRGWNSGQPDDPFRLSVDERSSGRLLLQMANSRGTFAWTKR